MARTKQKPKTGKHYRVVLFYARAYQPTFHSRLEAENFLKARGLTSKAVHYAELWEMSNEDDGEQLALYENSNNELVLK